MHTIARLDQGVSPGDRVVVRLDQGVVRLVARVDLAELCNHSRGYSGAEPIDGGRVGACADSCTARRRIAAVFFLPQPRVRSTGRSHARSASQGDT